MSDKHSDLRAEIARAQERSAALPEYARPVHTYTGEGGARQPAIAAVESSWWWWCHQCAEGPEVSFDTEIEARRGARSHDLEHHYHESGDQDTWVYTPSTDDLRAAYIDWESSPYSGNLDQPRASQQARAAEFDRWLAAHDAQVKAEALEGLASRQNEMAGAMESDVEWTTTGHKVAALVAYWARNEADRIAKEQRMKTLVKKEKELKCDQRKPR